MDNDSDTQTPPPNKQSRLQIVFTPTPPYLKNRALNISKRKEHFQSLGIKNTKEKLKKPRKPSMVLKGPLYDFKLIFLSSIRNKFLIIYLTSDEVKFKST